MPLPLIRTLLLGILLLPAMAASAQQVTFKAIGMDSVPEEIGLRQIEIFRNGTLVDWNHPSEERTWSTQLEARGNYKVWYATFSNRYLPIELKHVKRDTVILLPMTGSPDDSLMSIPFIDQLQEGHTLAIQYRSRGCYHSVEQEVSISLIKGKYMLRSERKPFELNAAQVQAVRQLEVDLASKALLGFCTTEDRYILTVKGNDALGKMYEDDSCRFNGFSDLLEALGKSLW